jgi:hypothetical protein
VALPIPKIDLDASLLQPKEDQVQFAVAIDIGQLGRHIPVLARHDCFGEPTFSIAEEGLDLAKMTGPHNVGVAIVIDVAGAQGGIANIAPGGRGRGEGVASTPPDVKRRVCEPGGRHESWSAIAVDIHDEGGKTPLHVLSQREGLRVARQRGTTTGASCGGLRTSVRSARCEKARTSHDETQKC